MNEYMKIIKNEYYEMRLYYFTTYCCAILYSIVDDYQLRMIVRYAKVRFYDECDVNRFFNDLCYMVNPD